jgi:hypothetical protein
MCEGILFISEITVKITYILAIDVRCMAGWFVSSSVTLAG